MVLTVSAAPLLLPVPYFGLVLCFVEHGDVFRVCLFSPAGDRHQVKLHARRAGGLIAPLVGASEGLQLMLSATAKTRHL